MKGTYPRFGMVAVFAALFACGGTTGSNPAGNDGGRSSSSGGSGSDSGSDASGSQASTDATAYDAPGVDAGNGSEAEAPFPCPDATSGTMCAAHQWCIVPCSPFGGGPPKPPFCTDDVPMSGPIQACPGGFRITEPIVECQCP